MTPIAALSFGALLGLVNAAHCAGMCGAFALKAAGPGSAASRVRREAAFLLGKTLTYTFAGAVLGQIGRSLSLVDQRFQGALGILVGVLMILWAYRLWRGAPPAGPVAAAMGRVMAPFIQQASAYGPFALGAITSFIPCGVTALGLAEASTTGGAGVGAILMLGLAIGTSPVLLALGVGTPTLLQRIQRKHAILLGASVLALVGALTIWRGLQPFLATSVDEIPCCH